MINSNDTIAAISTAMSNSGIGIVRVSGPEAVNVVKKIFIPLKEKDLEFVPSFTLHYGNIVNEGEIVDEVLVSVMRAPHTYTREDVCEINCHGGVYVTKKVLEAVLMAGARPAEPGEFTKRAFLNGRIDLSQAEAVIDVINSENNFALKSAVSQLKGSVSELIRAERAQLLEQIAYIEAALDDPEHIEMESYGEILLPKLEGTRKKVEELLSSADDGRILKEGIKTVILGKPNVGKSSLLNALMGQERAIVTEIAGTTRDTLEESVRLGDIVLNIIDTAGIRETEDIVEKMGVDKAKEVAQEADLIIFVADSSSPISDEDIRILDMIRGRKVITLLNKQDLGTAFSREDILGRLPCRVIETSLVEGSGVKELTEAVKEMFLNREISFNDQVYITNERQKTALYNARESLDRAMESVKEGLSEDFFTIDMMDAYMHLGSVIGEQIEDDLAEEIFAKFCMGK